MLGIIVQLVISWIIAWLYEKNDLRVLGFRPTKKKLTDFVLFFFVTAICCSSGFFQKMYFGGLRWEVNPALTVSLFFEGLWWNIKSVLFEELIFRGILFYILIRKLGIPKAIFLSSIAFGIYHWFSFGIIGNITQMIFVFFITGAMGLVYAYGYAKTMSLYIPSAIHLGWNFTQGFIFSEGSIGTGILKQTTAESFRTDSYLIAFAVFVVPMLSVILINFYLLKRKKQVSPSIYTKEYPSPGNIDEPKD
jgi:uncharacterized protein